MPSIPAQLERINDIYDVDIPAHTAQRIGMLEQAARILSRRGQVAAKVELANAALLQLCMLIYESDDDGKPANIDVTTRILVPLPWGRVGAKLWGLRATEARSLRYVMLARSASDDAWLRYDAETRSWCVAKPLRRHAMAYLDKHPITAGEWRTAQAVTQSAWSAENMAAG